MKIDRNQPLSKLIRRMMKLETAMNLTTNSQAQQRMEHEMGQIVDEINRREQDWQQGNVTSTEKT